MINVKRSAIRKFSPGPLSSFYIKVDKGESLVNEFHYHPELELILLKKSAGKIWVGNCMFQFDGNEVLLLGSNVPHFFKHDHFQHYAQHESEAEALVIQFEEGFLGDKFMRLPEVKALQELFSLARKGIRVTDTVKDHVIVLMEQIREASSFTRIVLLLEILNLLVDKGACGIIDDNSCPEPAIRENNMRLKKILDYTEHHYIQNIRLEEVAAIINLTKESFCRFFKSQTGKTYMAYLIEYRISQACHLLVKSDMSIKEIGFYIGYENIPHFYAHFKRIVKMSPLEFKNCHLALME